MLNVKKSCRFRMSNNKQDDILKHIYRNSPMMSNFKRSKDQRKSRSVSTFESSLQSPIAVKRISLETMIHTRKLSRYLPFSHNKHHLFIGERFLKCILDDECGKLEQMIRKMEFDFRQSDFKSLVHEACYKGCLKCLQTLIKNGFSVDCVTQEENWAPLHAAVMGENEEVLRYLIPCYKNVDLVNSNGISPLHVAVYLNNLLFVHILIRASANMFLATQIMTPFQLAIDLKHGTILDYFILSTSNNTSFDLQAAEVFI